MKAHLGIDVAKESFESSLVDEAGRKRRKGVLANQLKGYEALHQWLQQNTRGSVHICLESTSVYWEELALYLHQQGYEVSVVNPARIKGYALSQLRRSKTDPLDADVIADFCRTQQPKRWTPPTAAEQKLRALVRHREGLLKSRTQQRNRLATCRDEEVQTSLTTVITTLDQEIERVEKRLHTFFDDYPDLKAKKELLESIKGIGEITAIHLLAEMYDLDQYDSARAAAADAGITSSHYRSGTSVHRRSKMSRIGKASVRAALHFPAISARQHNPLVRQLVDRLTAAGKAKGIIHVAAMRKLMHLAYGVIKNNTPFDPAYGLTPA
jgi:transposase